MSSDYENYLTSIASIYGYTVNLAPNPIGVTVSIGLTNAIFGPNWSVTGNYADNLSQAGLSTFRTSGFYNTTQYNCIYLNVASNANIQTITFDIHVDGDCGYKLGGNYIVINNPSTNLIAIVGSNIGSTGDKGNQTSYIFPQSMASNSVNYYNCSTINFGYGFIAGNNENVTNFGVFEDPCGLI